MAALCALSELREEEHPRPISVSVIEDGIQTIDYRPDRPYGNVSYQSARFLIRVANPARGLF